ncbi:hypothetical protein HKBW3S43_01274 [Candidatus Hakubella thermalkaliphila]|uniref:Uncharacterized protein n=1 Tax=Candidatus Hakubella thermalkaliphila TaxID=2754717 RepID=A0A6V8P713_9ACTN|nr:hypothetical protein HKBW3S33_01564 [Candidatus Hakubella thermalkaliphila]GFP35483.1 hypothetical protein HKBW3S43_01274 [Candidatus Hakubella thermalkaliphila]GFP43344.1 hypothetical protein HKBW3C_02474 [Candidatus Hakubella thermalkaliphila]
MARPRGLPQPHYSMKEIHDVTFWTIYCPLVYGNNITKKGEGQVSQENYALYPPSKRRGD